MQSYEIFKLSLLSNRPESKNMGKQEFLMWDCLILFFHIKKEEHTWEIVLKQFVFDILLNNNKRKN